MTASDRPPRWTIDEKIAVLTLREAGATPTEIAGRMGMEYQRVRNFVGQAAQQGLRADVLRREATARKAAANAAKARAEARKAARKAAQDRAAARRAAKQAAEEAAAAEARRLAKEMSPADRKHLAALAAAHPRRKEMK